MHLKFDEENCSFILDRWSMAKDVFIICWMIAILCCVVSLVRNGRRVADAIATKDVPLNS